MSMGRRSHLVHSCLTEDLSRVWWCDLTQEAAGPFSEQLWEVAPHARAGFWSSRETPALLPWDLGVLHAHSSLLPPVLVSSPRAICCLSAPSFSS